MKIKTRIKLLDIISNITLLVALAMGFISDWKIGVAILCLYITLGIDIVIAPYIILNKKKEKDHTDE